MNAPAAEPGYLESLLERKQHFPGGKPAFRHGPDDADVTAVDLLVAQAREAEQAVIGTIILKGKIHHSTLENITPGDFGNAAHRKIYDAALAINRRGEQIDFITIMAELGPALEEIGGPAYLTSLTSIPFSIANVESYNRLILEAAGQRKLVAISAMIQEGIRNGQDLNGLTGSILKTVEAVRTRIGGIYSQRFSLSPLSSLLANQTPAVWLVSRFLEKGTLASLFGPPETLKTFIALSMGFSVATGCDWFGFPVKNRGPVVYLCGEGRRAIAQRGSAWLQENGFTTAPFYVSSGPAAMLDPTSLADVVAAVREIPDGPPALIIIDTLNRNFGPGDENSTGDMTRFVSALDQLKDRYGCAILVLHHTGLADQNRGRGNSSLHGAVDFQYTVKRSDNDSIVLTCSKCKDHQRPDPIAFKPKVINLGGTDDEGQPFTSLVLEQIDGPARQSQKVTPSQRIAFDALEKVSAETGKAYIEDWRQEAYRSGISDNPTSKRQAFNRARTALLENGTIKTDSDFYWIAIHSVTKRDNVTACNGVTTVTKRDTPLKGVTHVTHPGPEEQVEVLI